MQGLYLLKHSPTRGSDVKLCFRWGSASAYDAPSILAFCNPVLAYWCALDTLPIISPLAARFRGPGPSGLVHPAPSTCVVHFTVPFAKWFLVSPPPPSGLWRHFLSFSLWLLSSFLALHWVPIDSMRKFPGNVPLSLAWCLTPPRYIRLAIVTMAESLKIFLFFVWGNSLSPQQKGQKKKKSGKKKLFLFLFFNVYVS